MTLQDSSEISVGPSQGQLANATVRGGKNSLELSQAGHLKCCRFAFKNFWSQCARWKEYSLIASLLQLSSLQVSGSGWYMSEKSQLSKLLLTIGRPEADLTVKGKIRLSLNRGHAYFM